MTEWKAAGRAQKDADDALWQRFRTAQDAFFARRAQNFAERDAEFDSNAAAKRALLDEAEKIDVSDPDADPMPAWRGDQQPGSHDIVADAEVVLEIAAQLNGSSRSGRHADAVAAYRSVQAPDHRYSVGAVLPWARPAAVMPLRRADGWP